MGMIIRLLRIVGMTGLEPAAPSSQARCATNCATSRFLKYNIQYTYFID